MNKRLFGLVSLIIVALFLTACNPVVNEPPKNSKPIVGVTIVPQETFVKAIAGDAVDVITMVPPGSSPETYEPTPQQMADFSKAEIFFAIGMAVEETKVLPQIGKTPVVDLAEIVRKEYPDRTFEEGERDEHIWLSPKRIEVIIETMVSELSTLLPDQKTVFEKNGQEYITELKKADQEIVEILNTMDRRIFIVYHPAFGYFADEYGLTMVALEEEGKESTPQQLQAVVNFAKENGLKAVFYQQEVDSRQSVSFAEEIKGKAIQLSPLSGDYIQNLKDMAKAIAEAK